MRTRCCMTLCGNNLPAPVSLYPRIVVEQFIKNRYCLVRLKLYSYKIVACKPKILDKKIRSSNLMETINVNVNG